ncbi:MAG: sensor histidine kinase [Flavobacteriales bacterium]|nr:sensor histidine kinase [Flavobacteriales bacterium]
MKKSVIALLHIGFWICYLVLTMVILGLIYRDFDNVDSAKIEAAFLIILFFILLPSAISFYTFYFFLFPRYLLKKKIMLAIIYGLIISIGSAFIGNVIFSIIPVEFNCGSDDTWETFFSSMLFISFITLVCGIIALVIQGFITWFGEIKLKEALKQKNYEMEMALVKSQLDPHFLFNTINNIDVLILKNANEASNYLNKLSDIMRFMLFEAKTEEVMLSQEIEYIEKYIELQKIRTANSNYINFSVTGNSEGKMIAPMIFLPFIENAFKHTTNKKLDNAINISICIDQETVKLVCENKTDPLRKLKQESNGLGNQLIEKRLNLIYPHKHKLLVNNENNLYKVQLTISHGKI